MSFDIRIRNGDLSIGQDGDFEKIQDTDKLVQDILKILMCPVGSNVFFPWYGSNLAGTMVGDVFDEVFRKTVIEQQIRSNLETLQRLQRDQASQGQRLSPGELLAAIQEVLVNRNVVDPTFFSISVKVLTKGLRSATAVLDVSL